MNNITLAIPFYNTSSYFEQAVEYALSSNFVKEIIVSDDCSQDDEWEKLNKIVITLNTDKIKIFRNQVNLGGFRNKYIAVKNSSCNWVYLLDSDNHPTKDTLNVIESIQNPDPDICYVPQKLLIYSDDGYRDEKFYNFKYDKIGIDEAQDALIKKTQYFDWFLNTGNFVFNREKYLERLKFGFENLNEPSYACSVAFAYHWMNNGGYCKVTPGMEYYHRCRPDSYWNACGDNSKISTTYYEQKIINLP